MKPVDSHEDSEVVKSFMPVREEGGWAGICYKTRAGVATEWMPWP
jgi:hypothetical protein